MGVNSLLKTVTRQRRDCDLNPGPSAPEFSTLTTRLPSHVDNNNNNNMQLLMRHVSVDKRTDSTCKCQRIENFVVFNK